MGYWLSQVFWSAVGELFVAAIVGVVVIMWGVWDGTKRWTAVVGGIVSMAAIFLILNQSGWWEPPLKVKVHQWLDDVSFSVKDIQPTSVSDFEFEFEVTAEVGAIPNNKLIFYIHRPKYALNGFLKLETGYRMEGSFPGLKTIGSKERQELERQVQKDLLMKGVHSAFEKDGDVRLVYIIPAASATQESLLRGYEHLEEATFIVVHDIGLTLKE